MWKTYSLPGLKNHRTVFTASIAPGKSTRKSRKRRESERDLCINMSKCLADLELHINGADTKLKELNR